MELEQSHRLPLSRQTVAFLIPAAVNTSMKENLPKFQEWLAVREGLWMPDKAAVPGLSRLNVTPMTNTQRKRLVSKPVKLPNPFKPTVAKVGVLPKPSFLTPKITKVPRPRLP